MAENDATCLPLIIYYMREKFFRHAINTAVKYLQLYNNDPVLQFFKAFASLMEGPTHEAVRDLIHLKDQSHLSLCSSIALINAHKHCQIIDEETLNELNSDLKVSGSTASDRALYYAALLYWILDRNVKARTCINKLLRLSDTSPQGLVLKGWIMMTSDVEENRRQAMRYFDSTGVDSGDVFRLMGKVEILMARQKEWCALDIVNQMIVSHPDFTPALNLKMKIFMCLRDWQQTEELAHRILERDEHNLKALQMMTVIAAAKHGHMRLVTDHLQTLMNAIEMYEPNNSRLHIEITSPISRLCGHDTEIMQMLTEFMRRASSRSPVVSDVTCELGYLLCLQNKHEAYECYSTSLKTDTKSKTALVGLIRCLLICGRLEEAAEQLTFFCEVHESLGNTAEVLLLKAMTVRNQRSDEEMVVQLLRDAAEHHISALRGISFGVEYLRILDVNFLLQIVQMHMEMNMKDLGPGDPAHTQAFWLKHSNMILETIIRAAPGVSVSCYYMAYVKFLLGK